VGDGVALGVGVGGSVGVGGIVGGGVGSGVGLGLEVGVGVGFGDSCTKIGSVVVGVGEADGTGTSATSVERPAKTLATRSIAATVTPATRPPSSQSRRGWGVGLRDRPPWTTPL
jgi:hypothetical protein